MLAGFFFSLFFFLQFINGFFVFYSVSFALPSQKKGNPISCAQAGSPSDRFCNSPIISRFSPGKTLTCNVSHPWRSTHQDFPHCGYPYLNILYAPKIVCPSPQFAKETEPHFVVRCSVFSNPEVPEANMSWSYLGHRKITVNSQSDHQVGHRHLMSSFLDFEFLYFFSCSGKMRIMHF